MTDEVKPVESAETPVAQAAEQPQSLEQRMNAIYEQHESTVAAQDATTADKPVTESQPAEADAKPDGEVVAAEATPTEAQKVVVTDEEMRDQAFWGRLDKAGWERMERDYPVQTSLIKSAQSAASKLVEAARKAAPPAPESRTEAQPEEEFSPEYLAAVELSQSLDTIEAARGRRQLLKMEAEIIAKEIGVDPNRNKANALVNESVRLASEAMPELTSLASTEAGRAEIDAVIDANPALAALVATNIPANLAIVLQEAGKTVIANRKATAGKASVEKAKADAVQKKQETQKVVQANARPASADVVNSRGAGAGKPSMREAMEAKFDRAVARQNN